MYSDPLIFNQNSKNGTFFGYLSWDFDIFTKYILEPRSWFLHRIMKKTCHFVDFFSKNWTFFDHFCYFLAFFCSNNAFSQGWPVFLTSVIWLCFSRSKLFLQTKIIFYQRKRRFWRKKLKLYHNIWKDSSILIVFFLWKIIFIQGR